VLPANPPDADGHAGGTAPGGYALPRPGVAAEGAEV
jgi:hypothetical protein